MGTPTAWGRGQHPTPTQRPQWDTPRAEPLREDPHPAVWPPPARRLHPQPTAGPSPLHAPPACPGAAGGVRGGCQSAAARGRQERGRKQATRLRTPTSHPHGCHPPPWGTGARRRLCPSHTGGEATSSQPRTRRPQAGTRRWPHDPRRKPPSWGGGRTPLGPCQHPQCRQRQGHGSGWSLSPSPGRGPQDPQPHGWPPGVFLAQHHVMTAELQSRSLTSQFNFLPPTPGGEEPVRGDPHSQPLPPHIPPSSHGSSGLGPRSGTPH